jgi:hypothetical protein
MALEDLTGTKYIDDLNSSNPAAGDNVSEGDDHIRGIKNVLKTTFPNLDGAVNATDTELNYLDITTLGTSEASKALTADANGIVTINQDTDNNALYIDSEATSYNAILAYGKYTIECIQDISGGYAGKFTRNLAEAGSSPLVKIIDNHTSNTQPALKIQQDGAGYGLYIDQNGDSQAIYIDSESTSQRVIEVHGKHGISSSQDISGGSAAYFVRNLAEAGSNPLVTIKDDHTSNTQPALKIQQDGAGRGIDIDQNGDGQALVIDSESTTYNAIEAYGKYGLFFQQDISGGYGAYFYRNINEAGSFPLVRIREDRAANTQTALWVQQDGSGLCADFIGGDVKVDTGNLVIGTAGKGIDFSATADGTTMTSEVLDDYEEGYFEMLESPNITMNAAYDCGKYTKVGRLVTVTGYVAITAVSSTNTFLIGLPFTCGSTANNAIGSAANQIMYENIDSGDAGLAMYIASGDACAYFYACNDDAAWAGRTNAHFEVGSAFYFSISYMID